MAEPVSDWGTPVGGAAPPCVARLGVGQAPPDLCRASEPTQSYHHARADRALEIVLAPVQGGAVTRLVWLVGVPVRGQSMGAPDWVRLSKAMMIVLWDQVPCVDLPKAP